MATHQVRVDYTKSLVEEPETGHNRWHPDIAPVVTCDPGDEVVLDTRDAFDGQMGPDATLETVAGPNLNVVHPLTGPVYVNGAEPGDLLEVEILEVEPDRYGYTVQVPGFGFLRDEFPDPFMVRWEIDDGWATSDGSARACASPARRSWASSAWRPDRELLEPDHRPGAGRAGPGGSCSRRPHRRRPRRPGHRRRGPADHPAPGDRRQRRHQAARPGGQALIPVYAEGALFSAGDAHFAQGDNETCGTAIEMRSTLPVRFAVHKGGAAARGIHDLAVRPRRLLRAARVRRPAPVLRHHRACRSPGRREPRPRTSPWRPATPCST